MSAEFMDLEGCNLDDLAGVDFERLAVNCFTLCEDALIGSSSIGVGSFVNANKDVDSLHVWKDEVERTAECVGDKFLADEAIEKYLTRDALLLEENVNGREVEKAVGEKQGEIEEDHEASKIEDSGIEKVLCEKEEGEVEEDGNDEGIEEYFGGDALVPAKVNEQSLHCYEALRVKETDVKKVGADEEKEEGEIQANEACLGGNVFVSVKGDKQNITDCETSEVEYSDSVKPGCSEEKVGEVNEDDGIEEDAEDSDTDEDETEEVSEDDNSDESLDSENDEEEEADQTGNVTDTDDYEEFNDYLNPITSKNELLKPPPVKCVDAKLQPHHQLRSIGVISSIVVAQVIVEGCELHNPLNEGSILWITESKRPLGIIDEIFGPVKNPFYLVRFNSENEVPSQIQIGASISFVEEFSNHILNDSVLYKKGYDASGENDEELSDDGEFSDDEKEAEFKRKQKLSKRSLNDTKLKIDRKKPPKWKDGRHRSGNSTSYNPGTHVQPMGKPVLNGGPSYGPPHISPLSYGCPPQSSLFPYGCPPQSSPLTYGLPPQSSSLLPYGLPPHNSPFPAGNYPLPCGVPMHDPAWSAPNQMTQHYQQPLLNDRNPSFSTYQGVPATPALNQLNNASMNIVGFTPNRPPANLPASQGFNAGINAAFNFGACPNNSYGLRGRGRTRRS